MSVRDDQLIYDYLGKVADAAHGRLPSLARQDLVEKVRDEIVKRRQRPGNADITRVLQSMGDPRAIVDRAVELGGSEYAGYRPPITTASVHQPAPVVRPVGSPAGPSTGSPTEHTVPMPTVSAVSEHETGGGPVAGAAPAVATALFPPSPDPHGPPGRPTGATAVGVPAPERVTQVIRRRMTPYGPMTWLRTHRSARSTRVGRIASETGEYPVGPRAPTTLQPVAMARTYGREAAAVFALTVGAVWKPYLGWLVGLALVLWSKNWSIRDKGIAVTLIPALTLGGGIFYVWFTVGREHPPGVSASERLDQVGGDILGVLKAWPLVAALLAATWLTAQLLAGWAGEQRERWR
jgi:hypothetical protein